MVGQLTLRVPYRSGETATGYLGRLAARNGVAPVRFATEMGVSWKGLASGHDDALERMASLVGMPVEPLRASAFRFVDRRWWWGEERVLLTTLRRARMRVCPRCLLDDVNGVGDRAPLATQAWQRAAWCVGYVLTCPEHQTELVEVDRPFNWSALHDFTVVSGQGRSSLERMAAAAPHRRPSGLQAYLLDRKHGRGSLPWLDAMPFYVVADVTGLLGRVTLWGRDARHGDVRSLQDRHAADDAGFVLMRDGEAGVTSLLDHLRSTYDYGLQGRSHASVLGNIYETLGRVENEDEYAVIRGLVGSYIVDRFAPPPGRYLGVGLERRHQHTVATAAAQVRTSGHRLRTLLAGQGAIDAEQASKPCDAIVLDDGHAHLIESLSSRLTIRHAAARLRISDSHFRRWVRAGLIGPFMRGPAEWRRMGWFRSTDVDDLMERLASVAEACDQAPPGFVGLTTAARQSQCRATEIVAKLLAGESMGLRRLRGADGIPSLLLDPAKVVRHLREAVRTGLTLRQISERCHVSRATIRRLVDAGVILPLGAAARRGHVVELYDHRRLGPFLDEHVGMRTLVLGSRRRPGDLRRDLERAGIVPVVHDAVHGVTMYARSDLRAAGFGWIGGVAATVPSGPGTGCGAVGTPSVSVPDPTTGAAGKRTREANR